MAGATGVVAELCPACGMCCDGTLFGDVRLGPADRAQPFAAQGLGLRRVRGGLALPQPCAGFDGRWCRVYAERPEHCRNFECRLVQRVKAGAVTTAAALRAISEVRRQLDQMCGLLQSLGQLDETMPLNQRCAVVAARPYDLAADPGEARRRGRLMLAVARLARRLERDFLG